MAHLGYRCDRCKGDEGDQHHLYLNGANYYICDICATELKSWLEDF